MGFSGGPCKHGVAGVSHFWQGFFSGFLIPDLDRILLNSLKLQK